jgi:predicted NBD/HSP70 family sugar kinase
VVSSPVRQVNHDRVLEVLRHEGLISRKELAERTGLSRSTVSGVLGDLLASGMVEFATPPLRQVTARGRPAEAVRLAHALGMVGGLDYGHEHVRAALATLSGEIIAESRIMHMDTNESPRSALSTGRDLLRVLLDGRPGAPLLAVGVGLPSPVDPQTGIISANNVLPNWADTDPAADLERYLGVPVYTENDANLGVMAELRGAAGVPGNIIFLKVSSGIRAGLAFDGRIYHGHGGIAGEIGHVQVSSEQRLCRCGSRGCLETVVSLPRLIQELRTVHPRMAGAEQFFELVRRADAAALRVVGDAGELIGRTLSGIANVLAPDAMVVGGDLARAGGPFIKALERAVRQNVQAVVADALTVRPSTFGLRSEIVGALYLACERAPAGLALLPARCCLPAAPGRSTADIGGGDVDAGDIDSEMSMVA